MDKWYNAWHSAKQRCYNQNDPDYKNYGARGIYMAEVWRNNPQRFFKDMGHKPEGKTLDRKDNDGPYSPDNCQWTTQAEQNRNRRSTKLTQRIVNKMKKALAEGKTRKQIHAEIAPQVGYPHVCKILKGYRW